MQKSSFKADFEYPSGQAYLNTGAEGLLLKSCATAMSEYIAAKRQGAEGRPQLYEKDRECKAAVADLLGVSSSEIAILGNASEGLNRLCNSIPWNLEQDEVVIDDLEFPSNVLPWLQLREKGVRVKLLRHRNGRIPIEDFDRAINSRTRLVSISHVSYMTGSRLDIREIGRLARSSGAIFCVDATQSLGRIPVPVEEIDYLVASTYKWLLTPHGGGLTFCRKSLLDSLPSESVGWWSVTDLFSRDRFESFELKPEAARLELGMPNFPLLYGLTDAVRYLKSAGIENIQKKLEPVCDYLMEELQHAGVDLMTPTGPGERAGIVSFAHPDCEKIASQLSQKGVQVWGGDGRIRISVHLYNDIDEIELFLRGLHSAIGISAS